MDTCLLTGKGVWLIQEFYFNPHIVRGLFWTLLPFKLPQQCNLGPKWFLQLNQACVFVERGAYTLLLWPIGPGHTPSFGYIVYLWFVSLELTGTLPNCIWLYKSPVVCSLGSLIVWLHDNYSPITWGDSFTMSSFGQSPAVTVRGPGSVMLTSPCLFPPDPVGTGIVNRTKWNSMIPSSSKYLGNRKL